MTVQEQAVALVQAEGEKIKSLVETLKGFVDGEVSSLADSISAIPSDVAPDVAVLQAQITDLSGQLDAAKSALTADEAKLSEELSKEAKLQAQIDAVKLALGL